MKTRKTVLGRRDGATGLDSRGRQDPAPAHNRIGLKGNPGKR
jgi:hypothetical protein